MQFHQQALKFLTSSVAPRDLFVFSFLFFLSASCFLKFVLLQFIVPELNGGNGLLKGGDWLTFYEAAVGKAQHIETQGWEHFEIAPKGQLPVGLMSFLLVTTGSIDSYIIIYAFIYALSITLVYQIIAALISRPLPLISMFPFIVFPSTLVIYTQPHKDAWSVLGISLLLFSIIKIDVMKPSNFFRKIVLFSCGVILILNVRPYLLTITLLGIFIISPFYIFESQQINKKIIISKLVFLISAVGIIHASGFLNENSRIDVNISNPQPRFEISLDARQKKSVDVRQQTSDVIQQTSDVRQQTSDYWHDKIAWRFDDIRQSFLREYSHSQSGFDLDQRFYSASDLVSYVPRAFLVSVFGPFYNQWFSPAHSPGGGLMRLLNGLEMMIFYGVSVVFLLAICCRSHNETTIRWPMVIGVLGFCTAFLSILATAVPFMGTIVRMRFLPWSLICSLMISLSFQLLWSYGDRKK